MFFFAAKTNKQIFNINRRDFTPKPLLFCKHNSLMRVLKLHYTVDCWWWCYHCCFLSVLVVLLLYCCCYSPHATPQSESAISLVTFSTKSNKKCHRLAEAHHGRLTVTKPFLLSIHCNLALIYRTIVGCARLELAVVLELALLLMIYHSAQVILLATY